MGRSDFIPTSIAVRMTARLRATHTRGGISVFSGPPGLGKTTAIEAFKAEFPGAVAIMKVATQGARELVVMQHAIEAMRSLSYGGGNRITGIGTYDARNELAREIDSWAFRREREQGSKVLDRLAGNNTGVPAEGLGNPQLTFVFDEAQNLSRNAIETLRYWNDKDRCYAPFPVGLVFVGNKEFALAADKSGASAISAAVADRALYIERYEYCDMTNADLKLFLNAYAITDDAAVNAVLKHYSTPRTPRSLRQVRNHAQDILDEANGAPVTAAHAWTVLAPG